MDQAQLIELAKQLLLLLSPLIAQGALAKIGENTTDATQNLLKRTWSLLQTRFKGAPKAEAALTLYEDEPNDAGMQQRIAQQIVVHFQADQAAIAELQELVRALRDATGAPPAQRTHTQTIGEHAQVGTAVAGDVSGGISVGAIDFSRNKRTIVASPSQGASPSNANVAAHSARQRIDDAALSADGVHFSYGHALLIGIGRYTAGAASVPTTVADAVALGELLRDPAAAGYPAAQVQVVSNAQATRDGILAALDAFAAQLAAAPAAPDGLTALLFFAGHGEQRGDEYVLLAGDGQPISAVELHAKVAALRPYAQRLAVLLNCCHSGGVAHQTLGPDEADDLGDSPPPDFYLPLVAGGGHVAISAARPEQKAGAVSPSNPQHTVFGAQLLDALRGEAGGSGPGIGVFELFEYLATHIPADASQFRYRGAPLAQRPLFYARPVEHSFALALRPGGGGALGADLAAEAAELAALEAELAIFAREADAPADLVARRDAVIKLLEH